MWNLKRHIFTVSIMTVDQVSSNGQKHEHMAKLHLYIFRILFTISGTTFMGRTTHPSFSTPSMLQPNRPKRMIKPMIPHILGSKPNRILRLGKQHSTSADKGIFSLRDNDSDEHPISHYLTYSSTTILYKDTQKLGGLYVASD